MAFFLCQYTKVFFLAACGGFIELNDDDPSDYITSPNYPQNYPQNIDCIWVITAPSGEAIQIDFEDEFYIEPADRYHNFLIWPFRTTFPDLIVLGNKYMCSTQFLKFNTMMNNMIKSCIL